MKLDQFYTQKSVAIDCYNKLKQKIDIEKYDIIFEPSAGTGAFFNLLPLDKRIGIDLEPKGTGILKMDLFDYEPVKNKKYLTIGNPPFGRCCSLAVKFFNQIAQYSDVIAFIVPKAFKRLSIQNRLSLNFYLIYNLDLPLKPCPFETPTGVRCCFQIWERRPIKRNKIIHDINHKDFTFLKVKCNKKDVDIAIRSGGSNIGKTYIHDIDKLIGNLWIFIKANIQISILVERFKLLDYSIARDTNIINSIGQKDFIHLYRCAYGN